MERILEEISEISSSFTMHEMHVACRILIHHHAFNFFFFNHPTSIKWFVSWTVGNRLIKPLCSKMLDWLNFRLGVIIGLIHALEKRYSQKHSCIKTLAQYTLLSKTSWWSRKALQHCNMLLFNPGLFILKYFVIVCCTDSIWSWICLSCTFQKHKSN